MLEDEVKFEPLTHILVLIVKNGQVLLASKRDQSKFGGENLNGYGGKIEPEETPDEAALRETLEETGITLLEHQLQRIAVLDFRFPKDGAIKHRVCTVYLADLTDQEVKPQDTEEMVDHQWYKISELPVDKMWQADSYWMPEVLNGRRIKAVFDYIENPKTGHYELADWEIIYRE